jgi:uncharacterized protein
MKPIRCGSRFLGLVAGALMFSTYAQADSLVWPDPKIKIKNAVPLKASAFPLEQVRLLPGPFKHAMDLDEQYLLSLSVDQLLHNFRVNAGLKSDAKPLGGWEAPECELRGHFVGHYLSACALMYASTGDQQLKDNADAVVSGLAQCQDKLGNGYLSAFPESYLDRVEKRVPVWAPYYTLHKLLAGLQDMYVHCDNTQALEVAKKFANWVIARNGLLSDAQMQAMLNTEHGGMNETLANLYALTGDARYLAISLRFNHHAIIDPAEHREDKLTGLHANTQIPKFIGTARQYELNADPALRTASLFFWTTVTRERSYVIGGDSDGEMFSPKEHLSQALGRNTTETCNTYNMLKLTRHLFCWEPKAEYADYYERALYNHILASQNPLTGMMCYYVPLRSGAKRDYNTPTESFWCCTGTGVENHGKHNDSIYFHDDETLFVNLFIASVLDWKQKGITVRQQTSFPGNSSTELQFTCDKPVSLTLNVRHPFWATNGFKVEVNGEQQPASEPGFVRIHRAWNTGDRVSVSMPFALRTEAFADNPNRFALLYGPLVLAAAVEPGKPFPAIVADDAVLLASLHPVSGKPNRFEASPGIFRVPGETEAQPLDLHPFYQAADEHYVTYWDRFSPEQWADKQEGFKKQLREQRELESRTVDLVQAGEEQNERDHNFRGESTDLREFDDRSWRMAQTNGWFAWDLKVLPDRAQLLRVEYGRSRNGNGLTLLIDDKPLADPSQVSGAESGSATNTYLLSPGLLAGKEKVAVKFQALPDRRGRSVSAVRILKPEPGQ